jgi:S1-C subfamily serine protease
MKLPLAPFLARVFWFGFGCSALVSFAQAPSPMPAVRPVPASTPAAPTPASNPEVENSVVKIFSTARYPDMYRPWNKQAPRESSGTGVVIDGKRILTNAHVVNYASQVQVQGNKSGDKVLAKVEAYSATMDLAILSVEDESFFDTRPPLARANALPGIKDTVMAYGFPTGGTTLSITKGIVSRIEFSVYNFPGMGLRVQIDAAINPGNSGGPALVDDKMIGIAFSRLGGGDNIGYIIPNEEIDLFLADVQDGKYDGKPTNFDEMQTLINPDLRAFLKLEKSVEGVMLNRVESDRTALKRWDVVTRIGDTKVDNEGMVNISDNVRVGFSYLIQQLHKDGLVPLTIVRDGKEMKLDVGYPRSRPMVIPFLHGTYPRYFVHGPLVFSVLTQDFASGYNNPNLLNQLVFTESPLVHRRIDRPRFEGEELVVISSPLFPHRLTRGYGNPAGRVVFALNGKEVKNLSHLITLIRDDKSDYLQFQLAGNGSETLIFSRKELLNATETILSDNDVRAQGSPESMAAWTAGAN